MTKRIKIHLNANGEGTLECEGLGTYPCLGNPSMTYPSDVTVQGQVGQDKFQQRFSNEFQVNMNWAILLGWERGLFIHEGADTIAENGSVSAGCIHLESPNAKTVYDWVDGQTRITTHVANQLGANQQDAVVAPKFWETLGHKAAEGLNWATSLPSLITIGVFFLLFHFGGTSDIADIGFSRGLISLVFASGTIAIALSLVVSTLFPTAQNDGAKERFERGREILSVLVGIFGTILGFYFGSVGDRDATPILHAVTPATIEFDPVTGTTAAIELVGANLNKADVVLIGDLATKGTPSAPGRMTLKAGVLLKKEAKNVAIRAIDSSTGRMSNPVYIDITAKGGSPGKSIDTPSLESP